MIDRPITVDILNALIRAKRRRSSKTFDDMIARLRCQGLSDAEIVKAMIESREIIDPLK